MFSRRLSTLSRLSKWARERSPFKINHFTPHPGIQHRHLRGIFQYEYTRALVQYFSFIHETRDDDEPIPGQEHSDVFPSGMYTLQFLKPYARKSVLDITPDDLLRYREAPGPTHTLTPLSQPSKIFRVKIISTTPNPPTVRISVVILDVQRAGKKHIRTKPFSRRRPRTRTRNTT